MQCPRIALHRRTTPEWRPHCPAIQTQTLRPRSRPDPARRFGGKPGWPMPHEMLSMDGRIPRDEDVIAHAAEAARFPGLADLARAQPSPALVATFVIISAVVARCGATRR